MFQMMPMVMDGMIILAFSDNEIERDWYKISGNTKSGLDNEILHITVNSPLGKKDKWRVYLLCIKRKGRRENTRYKKIMTYLFLHDKINIVGGIRSER